MELGQISKCMDDVNQPIQPSRALFASRFFDQFFLWKRLLFKFGWIPLLTLALAGGIQVLLLKHTPPTFVSQGRMIVNVKLSIPSANFYSEELNNFFGTQVALMQSDTVKNRVVQSIQSTAPDLHPVPVTIDVSLSAKTSIFNLRAVGADPAYVQAYLRATMDEYIKLKRDLVDSASTATHSGMEEGLNELEQQLAKSKNDLLDYESSNSVVFLQPSGGNSAAEQLSALARRLAARESELRLSKAMTLDQNLERLQGMMKMQQAAAKTNDAAGETPDTNAMVGLADTAADNANQDVMPPALGEFEEDYLKARQAVILLRARMNESGLLSTNGFEYKRMASELAEQEEFLKVYKQQSEEQLQSRQHAMELEVADLQSQVKEWEVKAQEVSKQLSDYEALKENHLRLQNLYDQMQANLQTIDMNKGIGQEAVYILEPAGPAVPASREPVKHLVMAGLIGLFLGFGILVLINKLDDRPSTFVEVEHVFDLPVLAQIPWVKPPGRNQDQAVLQLEDQRYPLIEAYRSLRSAFLYKDSLKSHPGEPPKFIVIASAGPNDGKSMTAANLAITLAQAGSRILLVDADLRRGVLHKQFSVANGPGLAEVLAGQLPWTETVVPTYVHGLDLMPRGAASHHWHNLFAQTPRFMSECAGKYDYYIFDTAPVMVADDVLSIAPHADGLIFVVRAGFTSGRIARAALEMLRQRRVNVIGLAFNGVHPKDGNFYHYRYKDYYSTNGAVD